MNAEDVYDGPDVPPPSDWEDLRPIGPDPGAWSAQDDAIEERLAYNREVADAVRKMEIQQEAKRQVAERARGKRQEVRAVDGATFLFKGDAIAAPLWGIGSEILWATGETLMICGMPGVGKTTLAQQAIEGRLGLGPGRLLGWPIIPGQRRVLYLAMDRPGQIRRSLMRLFGDADNHARQVLAERLRIWPGPPPQDFATNTELLAQMAADHDADTVVIDSLKDAVVGLAEDTPAAAYNRARQQAIAEGVQLIELHHMVKRGPSGGKPKDLAGVYGSGHLTSGAGSVFVLDGEPGDHIVELLHLKQPADSVGPLRILHEGATGRTVIYHAADLVALARSEGEVTALSAARVLFETDSPSTNEREKARRRLDKLVSAGQLAVLVAGDRGGRQATVYSLPDDSLMPERNITRTSREASDTRGFTTSSEHHGRSESEHEATSRTASRTSRAPEHHAPPPLYGGSGAPGSCPLHPNDPVPNACYTCEELAAS